MVLVRSLLPLRVRAPNVRTSGRLCVEGVFARHSSGLREVLVAYMNVGRGCDATYEFLERSAQKGVCVAFVGECWVERKGGRGTQSHPDYVQVVSVSAAHRVACYVLGFMVNVSRLVEGTHLFVCV